MHEKKRSATGQWELIASRKEGLMEGKIEMTRMLQEILSLPVGTDSDFEGKTLEQLQSQVADLQDRLRNRAVS